MSFRSCSRTLGPGRNTTGRCRLHQAQPQAAADKTHSHASDQRIWRVVSVCKVTARRRPDQLSYFEMPFMTLVQHVLQDRRPNSTSPTCGVWGAAMINICTIWRYDMMHLAWIWRMGGPTCIHQHPDHYFICLSVGNWDGCRTHRNCRGKEH